MLQMDTNALANLARFGSVLSLVMAVAIPPAMAKRPQAGTSSHSLRLQAGEHGRPMLADADPGDVGPDSLRPPEKMADADPGDVGPDSLRPPEKVADVDPGDVGPDSLRPPEKVADVDPGEVGPDSLRPPEKVASIARNDVRG